MRKKPAHSPHHSQAYGLAIFIGALIGLLVVAACIIKLILLFQHSTFDGKHQFSLEIREPGQTRFVVFDPDDESIHTLLLHGTFSSKPLLALGVPVDAILTSPTDIPTFTTLANKLLFGRGSLHASMTIIDGINLFVFVHTADDSKTITQEISTRDISSEDAIFSQVFTDETIYKEGQSVAIINGTGISGLGTNVARLLTHLGANVVSVTTADTPSPKSSVGFSGAPTYTVNRLSHILQLPLQHLSNSAISDITVLLGTDKTQAFQ